MRFALPAFSSATELKMAIFLEIFNGLRLCVSTLWDLQEIRYATVFDDVSYIATTIIMAAVSCVASIRRRGLNV
ncbi:hypothetical protein CICLE_v10030423mg [Citrus x clementina]|uniref:Uncharacterized protein n=1 Tax=Citrus clementina TaxID=85681 RepID=V4SB27_CITCL|nr:hypothetical protein CICLE_v10030423mg [Citrus x clementina]GAY48728.1 hypothetical protein CUMW_113920 [Citrus unshiu]